MHFKDKNGHSIRMQSKATGVDWGKKHCANGNFQIMYAEVN